MKFDKKKQPLRHDGREGPRDGWGCAGLLVLGRGQRSSPGATVVAAGPIAGFTLC